MSLRYRTEQGASSGFMRLCICLGMLLLATPSVHAQSIGRGDLSDGEQRFLRELLVTYNSPDLLRVWVSSRIKTVSGSDRATLEYYLADAIRIEGEIDAYEAEISRLAKKYPNHQRSKGVKLESVLTALLRLNDSHTESVFATSPSDRLRAIQARDEIWRNEVVVVLEDNIRILNADCDAAEAKVVSATSDDLKSQYSEDYAAKVDARDLWEFQELASVQNYANLLADEDPARKKLLDELSVKAKQFVDQRYENFGRRYRAQLIYGQALAASGRPDEAAEQLELLVDIEPSGDPPYVDEVVTFIRSLRIESLAGSLEAYNRANRSEEGLELIEYLFDDVDENFPFRRTPENPEIAPLVAILDVEEAISRIAGGDRETGLDLLEKLIEKYDSPDSWKGDPAGTRAALDRLSRGCSRLFDMGVASLSAELCVRGAVGFRDRGKPAAAVEAAKQAFMSRSNDKDSREWKAKALYEIGESSDALGRIEEAAIAYQALAEDYSDTTVVAMACQNFFAIVGDLGEDRSGAWLELLPVAEKLFADNSQGLGSEQLKLQQASEAEMDGDYSKARDLFRRVAATYEDDSGERTVPFYYRARAGGARCLFRMSTDIEQGTRDASGEILALLDGARRDGNGAGESSLRYELARIHWSDRGKNPQKAIEALDPVLGKLSGSSIYREGALLLFLRILCSEGKLATAEKCLAEIAKQWPDELSRVEGTYYLFEACHASGREEDRRRAGELVLEWIKLPGTQFDSMEPAVQLGLSAILIDGGYSAEAAEMLAVAQSAAESGQDQDLQISVSFYLAKAANAAGKYQDALRSLDSIMERYSDDTFNGGYPEAPFFFVQRAVAENGLYEKDRNSDRLTSMSEDLKSALGILDQRRQSLVFAGTSDAGFERDYWATWLQYLEVLKAQKMCERVVLLIQSRRLMAGGADKPFATQDLQGRFDKLEKDCK